MGLLWGVAAVVVCRVWCAEMPGLSTNGADYASLGQRPRFAAPKEQSEG